MRSGGNHGEHEAFRRPVISGNLLFIPPPSSPPGTDRAEAPPNRTTSRLISSHPQLALSRGARGSDGRPRLLKPVVFGSPQEPPFPTTTTPPPVVHMRRSDPDGM